MDMGMTLRAELDELRAELARLRERKGGTGATGAAEAAGAAAEDGAGPAHFEELNRLVHQMLEDAEETIAEHPVATVAGALALGIVIGRLTAR